MDQVAAREHVFKGRECGENGVVREREGVLRVCYCFPEGKRCEFLFAAVAGHRANSPMLSLLCCCGAVQAIIARLQEREVDNPMMLEQV